MLRFNAPKNDQGFTLIEILTVLLIIGILSAIAVPSFLGLLNRGKVNNAVAKARGALQEAQRESIRKSKTCTVVVPAGNNVTLTSPTEDTNGNGLLDTGEDINANNILDKNNCLVTGDRQLDGVNTNINRSGSGNWAITFDFRGRTNLFSNNGTMFFSIPNSSVPKKCLVVSQGLGLLRTGNYNESTATPTCDTSR